MDVGEDLDLARTGEAGVVDAAADPADVDATFAHEAAVVEEIGGGSFPIADVEGKEALLLLGEFDLGFERVVPPHVIHIHGDAEVRWGTERVADRVSLRHGVDRAAVVCIHRMQGLDGELDIGGFRCGKDRRDAIGDLPARVFQ